MSAAWERGTEADSVVQLLRVVRARWLVVLLSALVFGGSAYALQNRDEPQYEATAQVLFGAQSLSDIASGIERGSDDPERDAATQVLLATSEAVASRAARDVPGRPGDIGDLLDQVAVEPEENADVLRVTASDPDPQRAAAIANAFAKQYVAFKRESETSSLRESIDDLTRRIKQLPVDSPSRADLEQRRRSLEPLLAVASGDARVISNAAASETPASLSPSRAAIVGVILGLAVGIMLAFLVQSLDRRVKDIEEFEREYRSRVLTVVPEKTFRNRMGSAHLAELEPFRILRSAIDLQSASRPIDVLMVTSAMPGEGKTTVAVDLAHAIALAGRRVALVELDLRKPTFARHFELTERTGVTTALIGRGDTASLLQRPLPSLPQLEVLPAGPLPPNPAELLESAALRELLLSLKREGLVLVIDSPPLIPVADAQVLLRQPLIDGALVVARAGVTTRDQVRRSRSILDTLAFEPLGVVVTGYDDADTYYGSEGYQATDPIAARA